MKIKLFLLGLASLVGLSTSALATHNRLESARTESQDPIAVGPGMLEPTGNRGVDALTFPLRFVGKAGVTIVHTPTIIAESFRGDRELMTSDRQFLGKKADRD